jgi:hypothetical protein
MAIKKSSNIEHVDASIKRWKTRLRRAINALGKLEKHRNRLASKQVEQVPASTLVAAVKGHIKRQSAPPVFSAMGLAPEPVLPSVTVTTVDTDIPEFLRRGAAAEVAADVALLDHLAAEEIKAKAAETKAAKARGRIATMKAKKSGETKKMPLSGRAALDAIKNG